MKNQRGRRRLVVVFYLGSSFAVFSLLPAYFYSGNVQPTLGLLWLLVGIGGFVTSVFALLHLHASIQGLSSTKDGDLDERQLIVRNRAYFRAYWALFSTIATLGLFFVMIPRLLLDHVPWLRLPQAESIFDLLYGLYWVTFITLATLPTMMIVWSEPDLEE